MTTRVLRAIIPVAVVAMSIGCASGTVGGGSGAAGQGPGGESGATSGIGGSGTPDGGTPSNANCLQIRTCVSACMDAACVQTCMDLSSPAGRMLFEQLQTCSKMACPNQQDRTCRCEAECIFPGVCADLQDMCADGVADPACEKCA
jgi:hypothetical protein